MDQNCHDQNMQTFRVSISRCEHEFLDMILRMEHKRREQLQLHNTNKRSGKKMKRGGNEVMKLKCLVNYGKGCCSVGKRPIRGRMQKDFFE